jgi:hypothetical protein
MFDEPRVVKVYRVTVKKIIERLLTLQEIPYEDFKNEVTEQFDGYDYKDVEELTGFESWPELQNDGEYKLNIKIDHEDAYEFTIDIKVQNGKVTVLNVL